MKAEDIRLILVKISGSQDFAEIGEQDDFYEFGLDSLDLMDVIFELDTVFGFEVSDAQFAECRTIRDILDIAAA